MANNKCKPKPETSRLRHRKQHVVASQSPSITAAVNPPSAVARENQDNSNSDSNENCKGHDDDDDATYAHPHPHPTEADNFDHHDSGSGSDSDGFNLVPLIERYSLARLDVFPFLMAYGALIILEHRMIDYDLQQGQGGRLRLFATGLFGLTLILHLGVVLSAQWSVSARVRVGYWWSSCSVEMLSKCAWSHCLVRVASASASTFASPSPSPSKFQFHPELKAAGIVEVRYQEAKTAGGGSSVTAIARFYDTDFRCSTPGSPDIDERLWGSATQVDDSATPTPVVPVPVPVPVRYKGTQNGRTESDRCKFRPLRYPIDFPLSFYSSWEGHTSLDQLMAAIKVYGTNKTTVQLPTFADLLREQLLAPFFLFQVLCVILWCLDEYWYYSIFTLFALLAFESTVAYNRLVSLQRLHTAGERNKNDRVWVRRGVTVTVISDTDAQGGSPAMREFQWMYIPVSELVPGDLVGLTLAGSRQQEIIVPADILLLEGTAVCDEALLTGESVPQLKQPIDLSSSMTETQGQGIPLLDVQDNQHKESILFGGTNLIVATGAESPSVRARCEDCPPDNGIKGMVLRTGFETVQGNLLRTMAHSSKNADGIHTWDTFAFILLLLFCAVGAAGLVLKEGLSDDRRNKFRLLLHVVIIITSVVPPELPMELSLAVTNSVAALMQRCQVYCTELFRIPWAGEVDFCCFDKTGTLTSDEMRVRGVWLFEKDNSKSSVSAACKNSAGSEIGSNGKDLVDPDSQRIPEEVLRIMAACHSLAPTKNGTGAKKSLVIGDPLEKAVFQHTGYELKGQNLVVPQGSSSSETRTSNKRPHSILHRFAFCSKLKRMTVIVTSEGAQGKIWALTKGAPETVKNKLTAASLPSNYDDVAGYHMSRGRRVLGMAYREVGTIQDLSRVKHEGRDAVEKDLTFAGFLVLDCPLKPDSKSVIAELLGTGHAVAMITGDAVLTAAEVARQLGLIQRRSQLAVQHTIFIIEGPEDTGGEDILSNFRCIPLISSPGSSTGFTLARNKLGDMRSLLDEGKASFCLSGDTLVKIALATMNGHDTRHRFSMSTLTEKSVLLHPTAQSLLATIVPLVSVFARHAPHHKEAVIAALNHAGYHTLMCGDGTNDVGALKRAHVGISIVSAPGIEAMQRKANASLTRANDEPKKRHKNSKSSGFSFEESIRQLREAQEELNHVELGDASVAAPFTSRAVSIKCCKDVIQQGRCTLVTMIQIYKILGVNCLVNALVLSKLFLHGVKQGDRQLTVLGIGVAILFYCVTRSEPLPTLSAARPPSSVMCTQALLSLLLQSGIHLTAIVVATEAALLYVDSFDPSLVPDGPFNPNVLNSCAFLLTCLATVNTFAANYRGHPFMQDLSENKLLFRTLLIIYVALGTCSLEVFPPLNELLQLTPFPISKAEVEGPDVVFALVRMVDFRFFLTGVMAIDTVLVFILERFIIQVT